MTEQNNEDGCLGVIVWFVVWLLLGIGLYVQVPTMLGKDCAEREHTTCVLTSDGWVPMRVAGYNG